MALTYSDVLLVPQYSEIGSRSEIDLETYITPTIKIDFPVIAINMDTVTGVTMAKTMYEYGAMSFYPRFLEPKEQAREVKEVLDAGCFTIPAVGIKELEMERVKELVKVGCSAITIDVAHGHLKASIDMVKKIKKEYKEVEVIAGVIATYEGARDLFEAGADAVRVGVGPGTICTTREVTGSGVPQITATMNAFKAGKEFGRPVLTDGGTKTTGDIVKALGAGANAVVVGSQLAGTEESPGEIVEVAGKLYKEYNGSTSAKEKQKQYGKYNADKDEKYTSYVEGVEAYVPYKGSVENVLNTMDKGIRSGLSYSGAKNIEIMHNKAKFVRVTSSSIAENGSHGVTKI